MGMLIDIHSHLDHPRFLPDIDAVISRAKAAGVRHIVTNGIDPRTNRICLELSRKHDIVECGMGIYPRDALKRELETGTSPHQAADFDIGEEINFIRQHKDGIIAISEIGLDFVHGEDQQQIEDFVSMLRLAKELDKPVVVHSRKAEERCIEVLEAEGMKNVVMHCFCGRKRLVERIVKNGWCLTVPTTVVRAQQFQDIAKNAPLTQLFCETDSPYLSPFKEQRNEPAFVAESYKKLAELKGMTVEDVAQNVYMNWQRMFK
ncbi:TPA: TatD family hydrolase [Candidatus Woesearchaeota archaeon]|nr:TatD family hydrolase [Candidatus Woesearchaeota archaeon]